MDFVQRTCLAIVLAQPGEVVQVQRFEYHHRAVDQYRVEVEHVGDTAGHAGRQIAPDRPEHHHASTGHVFQAVVADALDHRGRAGVARTEPLPRPTPQEHLARGGAVEQGIAGDHLFLGHEQRIRCGRTTTRPPESPLPT